MTATTVPANDDSLNVFNDFSDFDEVWEAWEPVLDRRSRYIHMPNDWDPDDTFGEMSEIFTACWQTYKPRKSTPFTGYYWTSWGRRRVTIWRAAMAQKRDAEVRSLSAIPDIDVIAPIIGGVEVTLTPAVNDTWQAVWEMLGQGYHKKEVMEALSMGRSELDSIIRSWRRPSVRVLLTEEGQGWE